MPIPVATAAQDELYDDVASMLQARLDAQVVAIRYRGLDTIGHRFLRYAMPRAFGDVSDDEQRRYGRVLDEHYAAFDARIGGLMASLGPEDLLLVMSGFGMEPVRLGERVLARAFGDPDLSGTHERAPDGFMLAYGTHVQPGPRVARIDCRCGAHSAVLPGPAGRPRCGRNRSHRHLDRVVFRKPSHHLHPDLRALSASRPVRAP